MLARAALVIAAFTVCGFAAPAVGKAVAGALSPQLAEVTMMERVEAAHAIAGTSSSSARMTVVLLDAAEDADGDAAMQARIDAPPRR